MKHQNKNLSLIAGTALALLVVVFGVGKASASNFTGAIKYDDFTTYSTRADFLARICNCIGGTSSYNSALYNDGLNVPLASIDSSVTYNGHPTMRYDQPAGVGSTPQLYAYFPNGQTLTHFWYKTVIRFSPEWTTTGTIPPPYANSYKILNWAWQPGINGRGGITITNTTQYQVYFDIIQNSSLITPDNLLALGNVKNEWTDGKWYDYIIEFNETSPTTAYAKVWLGPDGQTPVLLGTLYGTTNPGVTWPGVAAVNLGENFNQNRVNAQELWYGEWSVYDGSKYSDPYNLLSSTPVAPDTTAPTVSITSPAASTTLSGSAVRISASAADNIGVVGVQFKVDGTNYGAEATVAPYQVSLDTTKLSNGTHTITATARDAAGNIANAAPVTVTVSNTTTTPPPTTSGSCPTSIPSGSYLGCYYTGINFDTFTLSRNDPSINFDWSTTSPDPSIPTTLYSVRWQGNMNFDTGNYTFTATADDGVRLYIDGSLVIDKFIDQAATTYTYSKDMTSGPHLIKVEYYQKGGYAVAKLSWAKTATQTPPPVVTPPTSTTSPISIFNDPSGGDLSPNAFVADDFTKYNSTADLLANISSTMGGTGSTTSSLYLGGINVNNIQIDKTVLYNGHPTMKYLQPGGVGSTPQLGVLFPNHPLSHLWFRAKVRFSPGFTTTGTLTNSANAYKLLSWGWQGCGSGRIEITNTVQYDVYENVQNCSTGTLIGAGGHANGGLISGEWTTGGWYDYIVEVDHSAGSNGVIRFWLAPDGQTPVLRATAQQPAGTLPLITNVGVGVNFNQVRAADQSQALWWGQWEVVDGSQVTTPVVVPPVATPPIVTPPIVAPPVVTPSTPSIPVTTPATPQTPSNPQTPALPSSQYSTGTLVNDNGTIYLIRGGFKIGFTNPSAFLSMGYKFSDVIPGSTSNIPSSGYNISSSNQEHPWGTFLLYHNTVYYSTQAGMVGVPSLSILQNNGGDLSKVLPANSADISIIQNSHLPVMTMGDARVMH